MADITFKQVLEETDRVNEAFAKKENKPWTVEVMFMELTKQVGSLAKKMLAYEKYYIPEKLKENDLSGIKNELSDVFTLVCRIASKYNIDLEQAHLEAIRGDLKWISK